MSKLSKSDYMNGTFIEDLSPFDFDSTIEILTAGIMRKSWKISHIYDLQKTMEAFGKVVLPIKVLSICHPKHSSRILEKDSERIISPMMPCRISVYEKHNGKTYISRMNSLFVATAFGGTIEEVMSDSAKDVEEMIAHVLAFE